MNSRKRIASAEIELVETVLDVTSSSGFFAIPRSHKRLTMLSGHLLDAGRVLILCPTLMVCLELDLVVDHVLLRAVDPMVPHR